MSGCVEGRLFLQKPARWSGSAPQPPYRSNPPRTPRSEISRENRGFLRGSCVELPGGVCGAQRLQGGCLERQMGVQPGAKINMEEERWRTNWTF